MWKKAFTDTLYRASVGTGFLVRVPVQPIIQGLQSPLGSRGRKAQDLFIVHCIKGTEHVMQRGVLRLLGCSGKHFEENIQRGTVPSSGSSTSRSLLTPTQPKQCLMIVTLFWNARGSLKGITPMLVIFARQLEEPTVPLPSKPLC